MKIGFKGKFCIEPKPKEPTKHQYDSDAAACLNFLSEYDLLGDLKLVSGHWKLASQGRNEPASEIV
jgi:xylose isomerase